MCKAGQGRDSNRIILPEVFRLAMVTPVPNRSWHAVECGIAKVWMRTPYQRGMRTKPTTLDSNNTCGRRFTDSS